MYNEEDSVAPLIDAVRSALEGFGSWELVLVDDGSSDRTASLAEEYASRDSRVRFVRLG